MQIIVNDVFLSQMISLIYICIKNACQPCIELQSRALFGRTLFGDGRRWVFSASTSRRYEHSRSLQCCSSCVLAFAISSMMMSCVRMHGALFVCMHAFLFGSLDSRTGKDRVVKFGHMMVLLPKCSWVIS